MIVTFYSFKGGVGRSMAMANVAEILAGAGYQVVACDWDLEAPGLERSFTDTQIQAEDFAARPGVMDLLRGYKETLVGAVTPAPRKDSVKVGDLWLTRPSALTIEVAKTPAGGSVRLLTAGARPSESYKRYADEVRGFDWKEFYEEWAGGSYIDFLRQDLSSGIPSGSGGKLAPAADITLIDSRTGVTEHGGVCTHHLADLVVLMSAANDSNFYGSLRIARSLGSDELKAARDGRPLAVLPVRTRIEITSQVVELNEFRERFDEHFSKFVLHALRPPSGTTETTNWAQNLLAQTEIPYIGLYSFGEINLTRAGTKREPKLFGAYRAIADAILAYGLQQGLLREGSPRIGVLQFDTESRAERLTAVDGSFEVRASPDSAGLAAEIATDLAGVGVRVVQESVADNVAPPPTGALLLIGPQTQAPWIRAQFDDLLRHRAAQETFRILVLLAEGVDPHVAPYISRARVVSLQSGVKSGRLSEEVGGAVPPVALEPRSVCPYPGFRAFDEDDARFYFGRDEEIRAALAKADRSRALMVQGPRGIGKTSFVMAGLLPAIRRGALRRELIDAPLWVCAMAARPLAELAAALADSSQTASDAESALEEGDGALARLILERAGAGRAVLYLDGAERLWAPDVDRDSALRTVRLIEAASDHVPGLFVIASFTADGTAPRLGGLFEGSRRAVTAITLGPLKRDRLVEAIVTPPRLSGITIDNALAERLAEDVLKGDIPLAFLQLALRAVWYTHMGAGGTQSRVTESAWHASGEWARIVVDAAATRMKSLTDESQRRRAERLLARLALDRSGADRGLTLDAALRICGGGPEAERLIQRLADQPPILEVRSNVVRLAGRVLPQWWGDLRTWMDAERHVDERFWTRRARVSMAAAILVLAAAAAGLWVSAQRRESEALGYTALLERDPIARLALATEAGSTWETTAAREALEIALRLPLPRALLPHEASLRSGAFSLTGGLVATGDDAGNVKIWDAQNAAMATQLNHRDRVNAVRFAPDGRTIATASYDGSVAIWEVATGNQLWKMTAPPREGSAAGQPEKIVTVEWSPDGSALVVGGFDGSVWLRRGAAPALNLKGGHSATVTTATFSPDGRYLLTSSLDGSARLWNAQTTAPTVVTTTLAPGALSQAAFSPFTRDQTFAIAGSGGGIWLLSETAPRPLVRFQPDQSRELVAFSPRGRWLATGVQRGVRILNAQTGEPVTTLVRAADLNPGPSDRPAAETRESPKAVQVSFRDEQLLLVGYDDGAVALWDLTSLEDRISASPSAVFRRHRTAVRVASFSPDGRTVLTADDQPIGALWNVDEAAPTVALSFRDLLERARNAVPRNYSAADGGGVSRE
jgi:WD40 repeat protein